MFIILIKDFFKILLINYKNIIILQVFLFNLK